MVAESIQQSGVPSGFPAFSESIALIGNDEERGLRMPGKEQDDTITSSSSLELKMGIGDGNPGSTSSSSCEEELKSVIDSLEQKMSAEDLSIGNATEEYKAKEATAHSVEYWTVSSKGNPKALLKRYSAHRHSRYHRQSFINRRANNAFPINSGRMHGTNIFGVASSPQVINTNYLPPPFSTSPFQSLSNPHLQQVPHPLQFQPTPPSTPESQQINFPSIQIFIPPEQRWVPPLTPPSQFIPYPSVSHLSTTPIFQFPLTQQQPYIQIYAPPMQHNPFPFSVQSPVSFYQGAPLFYQTQPPVSNATTTLNPLAQPFSYDENYSAGFERMEYPPPTYDDAILASSSTSELVAHQKIYVETEPDSTTTESDAEEQEQHGNSFLTPHASPSVSTSSSDTNISEVGLSGFDGTTSTSTSGYNSCSSSPLVATGPSEIASETFLENSDTSALNNDHNNNISSTDEESNFVNYETLNSENDVEATGLESYSMELQAYNYGYINTETQELFQDVVSVSPNYQQNLIVYPGESSILIYSQNDGYRNVILYNEQEIPYVANVFDLRVQANFKEQCGPALTYPYYVPPRTADNDFFGGQLPIWQVKMGQYFLKYQPHHWKMHGVPETFNIQMFLGRAMETTGEFHIVSKLRFSCRTCRTPWTSKKGTIVFKFSFNSAYQQGWILMRIFGQICMRQECSDWTFQNPACYPEEIDRAMRKLSEYIGNQCYGIAVPPSCFDECFKSIRRSGNVGNNTSGSKEREKVNTPPTPHKKEFCQACLNGVCKNLFTKPLSLPAAQKPMLGL